MRLTDLVWAVTAVVGVSCIFAQGKDRGHFAERRRLHFDANPKHIPLGRRDRLSYDHIQSGLDTPNEILITTYEGSSRYKSKRPGSHKTSSFSSSVKDSSPTHISLEPLKPLSHSTASINSYPTKGTARPSSSRISPSKVKHKHSPHSTTFRSFDSFLNSLGTSFKIADDVHAIRARSDVARSGSGRAGQPGLPAFGYLNDQQTSQDLYESNALGIDVFEQDKATLLNMPERCCGSKVPIDADSAKATGRFDRVAAAGSIKVVEVPEENSDLLPPSAVRDLKISLTGPRTIMLTWTTPGDDLDSGKVSRYIIRLSDTRYDLRERRFDQASSYTELDLDDLFEASGVYQEAGTKVKVTVNVEEKVPGGLNPGQQYYLAFRSLDDFNNTSPVSNVATFTLPKPPATTTTTTTTTTTVTPPTSVVTTTTTHPPTTSKETFRDERTTEEYKSVFETSSGETEHTNQIIATLEGHIASGPPEDEPRKRRKERKKTKGRKNRRRKTKGKRVRTEEQEVETFDSYKYPPGCLSDDGRSVGDGKLCDAISSLLTVIDYFEQTREYKHLDYLSAILVTLRNRAQPHWRVD
ncbi:uncharacterized protein LOC135198076 [Macrobrachium nipponense]|uniref:uncharacterized protein LOC135198076 n=1 Tax=Macrobrachium nipponense TaxID=159736 RepID=UPI0030C832EE